MRWVYVCTGEAGACNRERDRERVCVCVSVCVVSERVSERKIVCVVRVAVQSLRSQCV